MTTEHNLTPLSLETFRRQMVLEDWEAPAQKRLQASKVLIVGCGGLGAPVIQYLSAAGIGHLTLMDDDRVQRSNLNRQTLFGDKDIGRFKTEAAADFVRNLNPHVNVEILSARLAVHNGRSLVRNFDLVFDCTDGLPNKYLLNDICVLEKIPLMHGAVSAWSGQLLCIEPGVSACLRCTFPDIPPPEVMPSCQTVGVLGASCGVVGAQMSLWGLRRLATQIPWPMAQLWALDLRNDRTQMLRVQPDKECQVCGVNADIDGKNPQDYEAS